MNEVIIHDILVFMKERRRKKALVKRNTVGHEPQQVGPGRFFVFEGESQKAEQQEITERDVRDQLAAFTYALNHRLNDFEKSDSRMRRMMQWLEDKLYGNRVAEKALRELVVWTDQLRLYLSGEGSQASCEQLKELLEQVQRVQQQAMEEHAIPYIVDAPSVNESMENQTEDGPLESFEVTGGKSAKHHPDRHRFLGEYGQDGYRFNRKTGTVVQWDGVGSYKQSYEFGEIGGSRIDAILSGLPDTSNESLIEEYIQERWPEITREMYEYFSDRYEGAIVLTAVRPLQKSKKLVCLKIGDSEIVIGDGKDAEEILQNKKKTRGTKAIGVIGKGKLRRIMNEKVRVQILSFHEGDRVVYRQSSDGLEENTGKDLLQTIQVGDLNAVCSEMRTDKDDIVITEAVIHF